MNEDSYVIDAELGLYVVCDGLGGHAAGEVASRTAVEVVARHIGANTALLEEARNADDGRFAVQVLVDEAINAASEHLYELACSDAKLAGMATTLTLALLWNDTIVVGHVGDCRIFLLRNGALRRLTSDHTMAAELCRRGQLDPSEVETNRLSHALTRSVGGQAAVLVDTFSFHPLPGDTLLACTDGLYRYFDDDELAQQLTRLEPGEAPGHLIGLAIERGGADNITAVLLRITGSPDRAVIAQAEDVQARLTALARVPFLHQLPLRHLSLVLEVMEPRSYRADQVVLGQSAPLEGLYVLVAGEVAGLGSGPGAHLGERELTGGEQAHEELRARADCEVLFLPSSALRRLVRRHPLLGTRLFWNLLRHG